MHQRINNKKRNLFFIILLLLQTYIIYKKCTNKSNSLKFSLSKIIIKRYPILFFGIVTVEKSQKRRNITFNFWVKDILKFGHTYVYCTQTPIEPIYNWVKLKNWSLNTSIDDKNDENIDRQNKRITMAEYFLKNTTADFFINPTDDVLLDPNKINEFAIKLGKKYDPKRDFVILGNCQTVTEDNFSFLQGGTGYIMTRSMAKKFIELSSKWINETQGVGDDYALTTFLKYIGKKPADGAIPYMIGHGLRELINRGFSIKKIPFCPNYYEPYCNQGVYKLNDAYMLHPLYMGVHRGIKAWEVFQKLLNDQKHHYGFYNKYHTTHVCKFD